MFVANTGDSRGILVSVNVDITEMSRHKPNDSTERNDIQLDGVFFVTWRVGEVLAVSCSFGDRHVEDESTDDLSKNQNQKEPSTHNKRGKKRTLNTNATTKSSSNPNARKKTENQSCAPSSYMMKHKNVEDTFAALTTSITEQKRDLDKAKEVARKDKNECVKQMEID
eukprot:356169_1